MQKPTKEFPGNTPAEAWKLYKADKSTIPPQQVLEFITDCLTGMTPEGTTLDRKNLWGLTQLTIALSTDHPTDFDRKSWGHVADLARQSRELNKKKKSEADYFLLFISVVARLTATGAPEREA